MTDSKKKELIASIMYNFKLYNKLLKESDRIFLSLLPEMSLEELEDELRNIELQVYDLQESIRESETGVAG